jgi:hypothetical protein
VNTRRPPSPEARSARLAQLMWWLIGGAPRAPRAQPVAAPNFVDTEASWQPR